MCVNVSVHIDQTNCIYVISYCVFLVLHPSVPLLQVLMLIDDDAGSFLCQRQPALSSMTQRGGVATAYVCQDFTCSLPVTDPQELRKLLLDGTLEPQAE